MTNDDREYTFFHEGGPITLTEQELCNEYMRLRGLFEQLEAMREALKWIERKTTDPSIAFQARHVLSNPAIGPHETPGICDHIWSLPTGAGVYRCMKCGIERTELSPASRPS